MLIERSSRLWESVFEKVEAMIAPLMQSPT
jgi:hypothetical protein